jgi:acyl-CoA synthetase (NDP forming)
MAHHLDPLLRPSSIAVLGATTSGGVGKRTLEHLLHGQYQGDLYGINPKYDEVLGVPCFPDLASLAKPVEHVIFAVSDHRLEVLVDDVIEAGVKAITIMSMLYLDDDEQPYLKNRIQQKVNEAGILLCGANGMGFYNFEDQVWACGFNTRLNHILEMLPISVNRVLAWPEL